MFNNYITTAFRNLVKNRLYALINIVGLAIGLAVFVFGTVLVDYEKSHDRSFANFERIYTPISYFSPSANISVRSADTVYAAFGEHLRAGMPELEGLARVKREEFLFSIGEDDYYQDIRFTDADFTRIFQLTYLEGDASVLLNPSSLLITRSVAEKYFGDGPAVGQTVMLDHTHAMTVAAVVEDLPANTHFNSSVIGETKFEVVANFKALQDLSGYDPAQDWGDLSLGNRTYILLPQDRDETWLRQGVQALYDKHYSEDNKEFISSLDVVPLVYANTYLWDAVGLPLLLSVTIMALLVLVVACVNYTNLAIAQSLGRRREVGLRRTLGAERRQLLVQFLTESVMTAMVAMFIALVALEMLIPVFNQSLGKIVVLDYGSILPWLVATTLIVGIASGGYPAYLITRTDPIEALRDGKGVGRGSSLLRSAMIALQFVIAIFMLATVLVMYFQNQRVKETVNLYPSDQILALERLNVEGIEPRLETLRTELKRLPGVVNVSYTNQVPFYQSNRTFDAGPESGDASNTFSMNRIRIDHDFLKTLDIQLIAGRDLSRNIARDAVRDGTIEVNAIVNELAASRLGFASPEAALGQQFYNFGPDGVTQQFTVVGVMEDQNFLGLHNSVKPFTFYVDDNRYYGAVRIRPTDVAGTLAAIEAVWDRLIPDYPMQSKFLDEQFDEVYVIFRSINLALSAFAVLALSLALIGLFGLAAFMAEQRTREIGIRRVLGASVPQLVRLLIWQFSKPVVWALVLALPLAYVGASLYLDIFADRITLPIGIIALAGLIGIAAAWAIVATHATWVARANPVNALRHE